MILSKDKKAYSLIELTVIMVMIGILGATTAGALIPLTQMFITVPERVEAQRIAQEIIDAIVEGTPERPGLRYAREITGVVSTDAEESLTYNIGYPTTLLYQPQPPYIAGSIKFSYDRSNARMERFYRPLGKSATWAWTSDGYIPPQITGNTAIVISGWPVSSGTFTAPLTKASRGIIFSYFKSDGAAWPTNGTDYHNISRIDITISVWRGNISGSIVRNRCNFAMKYSIGIKQYY